MKKTVIKNIYDNNHDLVARVVQTAEGQMEVQTFRRYYAETTKADVDLNHTNLASFIHNVVLPWNLPYVTTKGLYAAYTQYMIDNALQPEALRAFTQDAQQILLPEHYYKTKTKITPKYFDTFDALLSTKGLLNRPYLQTIRDNLGQNSHMAYAFFSSHQMVMHRKSAAVKLGLLEA